MTQMVMVVALFAVFRLALRIAPNWSMRLAFLRAAAIDRQAISDEGIRRRLIETFASGLAPGVRGPVSDMAVFSRDWGINLNAISAPVRIWIGSADRNVPLDGVHRLARAIKGSEVVTLPGEGHLWISRNGEVVMQWLADQARSAP